MTLRKAIQLLIFVPLVALVILGAWTVVNEARSVRNSLRSQALIVQGTEIGDLIHALQVERGQSAGHLASSGRNFADTLPQERRATDLTMNALAPQVSDHIIADHQLLDMRTQVSELTITVPEMAKFYTAAIRRALALSATKMEGTDLPDTVQLGSAMLALADAKEWAGLQRAAGATGLGQGAFSLTTYQNFLHRGAAEAGLLQRAEPMLQVYLPTLDLGAMAKQSGVTAFRQVILEGGPKVDLSAFKAPDWFATSTRWIEALRTVELDAASLLSNMAYSAMRQSLLTLVVALVATLASGGLSLALGLKFLGRFDRQIRTLTGELSQVAQKDFDFQPTFLQETSEIGVLSRSLEAARVALEDADRSIAHTRTAVLNTLDHHLHQLSMRDLSKDIVEDFPADYQGLKKSYNATLRQLDDVIEQIRAAANGIRGGSASLFDAALDMSHRVDQQAASLEETNAALQQISSNARETVQNVKSTKEAMDSLMEDAEFGVTQMHDASSAMTGIVKVADEMTKVVDLIDDISFQTNLLALNAGIEAARAGEAGKGFAVVAAEVRSLAMTAGGATRDIQALITRSQTSVQSGVSKVEETARIFERVKSGINKSRDEVGAIAPIAEEQSLGVQEIRGAIDELDKATQFNASVASSNSEICKSLKGDASSLSEVLATFKTSAAGAVNDTLSIAPNEGQFGDDDQPPVALSA